jgi:hypothetical protein
MPMREVDFILNHILDNYPTLILDSRVVAFEDGVYSRYPIPRSLTGVHP